MDWVDEVYERSRTGDAFIIVTVVDVSGSAPREIGAKMIVCGDGIFSGTIGGGQLESIALLEADGCFKTKKSKLVDYTLGTDLGQCCGGKVSLFYEYVPEQRSCYLIGSHPVFDSLPHIFEGTNISSIFVDIPADTKGQWNHQSVESGRIAWNDFYNLVRTKDDFVVYASSSTTAAVSKKILNVLDLKIWCFVAIIITDEVADSSLLKRLKEPDFGLFRKREWLSYSDHEMALEIAAACISRKYRL